MSSYQSEQYALLRNNCNHFASQLCLFLTGKQLPGWVNAAADLGAGIQNGLEAVATELSWDDATIAQLPNRPGGSFIPAKRLQHKPSVPDVLAPSYGIGRSVDDAV